MQKFSSIFFATLCLCLAGNLSESLAAGQDLFGSDTPPPEVLAAFHGIKGIQAFVAAGGRFTGQKNANGQTAAMFVAANNAAAIEAFVNAGGKFTEDQDIDGKTAAM